MKRYIQRARSEVSSTTAVNYVKCSIDKLDQ